jgi:hypothetical protein
MFAASSIGAMAIAGAAMPFVGPVVKDDVLLCKLEGLPDMSIKIV